MAAMVRIAWTLFVLVAIGKVSIATDENTDCVDDDTKCTANDARKTIYHRCAMAEDLSLWCNHSKFLKVPKANDILTYKSCSNASALYIDDSCLTGITRADMQQYPNITALTCGKNYIGELPSRLFSGNKRLRVIDFCTNLISTIGMDALKGLSELERLNLANNLITEISDTMLDELDSLTEVTFHNNRITLISDEAFKGLKSIKVLRLSANKIGHIEEKAFESLKRLTHLHLDENKLEGFEPGTFAGLERLQVLTISYNRIKTWPELTGGVLSHIHTLNFAANLIPGFTSTDVANMSQLQNLSLENNSLTALSEELFLGNPNLRYLNFAMNYLEHIGPNTFCGLRRLETLDLRKNKLKTPHANWFVRVIKNNRTIGNNISENPWQCDCDIVEYEQFLHEVRISRRPRIGKTSWLKVLQVTCDSPKHLKGQSIGKAVLKSIKRDDERGCATLQGDQSTPCNYTLPTTTHFTRITTTYKYTTMAPRNNQSTETRLTTKRQLVKAQKSVSTTSQSDVVSATGIEKKNEISLATATALLASSVALLLAGCLYLCIIRFARKRKIAKQNLITTRNVERKPLHNHNASNNNSQVCNSSPTGIQRTKEATNPNLESLHLVPLPTNTRLKSDSVESGDSGYDEDREKSGNLNNHCGHIYDDIQRRPLPSTPSVAAQNPGHAFPQQQGPGGGKLTGLHQCEVRIDPEGGSIHDGDFSDDTRPKRLVGDNGAADEEFETAC